VFEEEHRGPTAPETDAEIAFRFHWIALGLFAAIASGGNAAWAMGCVAAFSFIGTALLLANRASFEGPMKIFTLRTLFWIWPALAALIIFMIGRSNPAFHLVPDGERKFWELLPLPSTYTPISGSFKISGVSALLAAGVFAATANAVIMGKNRLLFARTWAVLVIGAGALAVLGIIQAVVQADKILWLLPINNPHFFASFPHPAQWSAFALLWMSAGLGLLAWLVRQRGWRLLQTDGWLLLLATVVLGVSLFFTAEPLHLMAAAVVASIGCFVIAWQTHLERRKKQASGLGTAVLIWSLFGIILAGSAAYTAVHYPTEAWIVYEGETADFPVHERVVEDTQNMWHARPWFGWGYSSYPIVYSFFQGADQGAAYRAVARSDFWQSLAEHGLIGTLIWWVPAVCLIGRLVWRRRVASFLIAPLAAIAAVTFLSVVDFPLNCPAVYFGYWLILFSLVRWSEVDQENTVSAPSERRRIQKLREQGQTLPPKPAAPSAPAA